MVPTQSETRRHGQHDSWKSLEGIIVMAEVGSARPVLTDEVSSEEHVWSRASDSRSNQ